jgi:hypothetical protein
MARPAVLLLVAVMLASLATAPFLPTGAAAQDDPSASPSPSGDASGDGESEIAAAIPPADLPTGNLRGLDLVIDASLDTDLDDAPTEADVYSLTVDPYTLEETRELAERIGLDGEVEERGNDTFVVSGNGELFVSPQLLQYLSDETPTLADLPSDEEAINFARDWLRSVGLAPADLGEGEITSRTEAVGRVSVVFYPTIPSPILAAEPNISVTIGPDGVVLEAAARWSSIAVVERYLLRPAEDAWRDVEAGSAYIEAEFDGAEIAEGASVAGEATYTDVSVAYTTAGSFGGNRYLVPVYVFSGEIEAPDVAEGSSEVRAYVPAIVTDDTPVG